MRDREGPSNSIFFVACGENKQRHWINKQATCEPVNLLRNTGLRVSLLLAFTAPLLAMPRKKTGGTSAEGSSSSTSSEHASVPDRGVSADKMRELTRRHDKLCHSLHSSEPAVVREDLVPERPDYLVMYHNLLSPSECRSIIDIIDAVGLNEASKADTNPRKGEGAFDCQ